ncbi:MAG TPA: mycofactocin biosynthesis glycosyltransferase MftF [Nocardioides sp.]
MTQIEGAWGVRLADGVRVHDRGRLLIGGSPLTILRLTSTAHAIAQHGHFTITGPTSQKLADRFLATNIALPVLDATAPRSAAEITVVIPVRDRPAQLDRALSALSGMHCLVIDDASHNRLAVAEVAARHDVEVIHLATNIGPAGARNAGLARVSTPLVAFVDSDVTATRRDLLALSRHFTDPAVAMVAPRVTGTIRSRSPRWFERYDAAHSSLDLNDTPACVHLGSVVSYLPSACLLARTSTLGDGFADDLRVGEDVDLVWRLVAQGHRVRHAPETTVGHDVRATLRDWLGRKIAYGTSGAPLADRHPGAVAPAVLSPTLAIGAAALLTRRPRTLPVAVGAVALTALKVGRNLPEPMGRSRLALSLATRGLGWAVRQEAGLVTRHWWPAALIAAVVSRRARRTIATAVVIDTVLMLRASRGDGLAAPIRLAGHALDNLAYGTGLWCGAIRARSAKALLPRCPGSPARVSAGRRAVR